MKPDAIAESKPYKGPDSYEIEDSDYFFGRNRESELLISRILCSRCTLLHAQSGTGKTSLLNARVLPALEEQGSTAFRILLRQNPSEAVRINTLLGLLPPPEAESRALARVLSLFWKPNEDPTIGEILNRFDHERATAKSDPKRRQALMPLESSLEVKSAGLAFRGSVRPLFLRLLRATLEISQYAEHLSAIRGLGCEMGERTRAGELRDFLNDPATEWAHSELVASVYIPAPGLREFFSNLIAVYGRFRTQFGLVLILDQFEELFTLFCDNPRDPARQLWRLRWEFIEKLAELYEAGSKLPVRYVISMRDEYIAQLDPLRRFMRDLDSTAFHLSFLEKDEAKAAISNPAKLFGYEYSDECYDNIFKALVREDRFVEPAPLQIVCEKLWREQGKFLAQSSGVEKTIEFAAFPPGGTQGILDSFFTESLHSLESATDRLETLEMLEPLVTANRTRNIVQKASLVHAPFRNSERRERLLENLERQRIVRVERRLGGQFVEITHEFLIAPVLDKIQTMLNPDPEYGPFRWAVRTLERFEDVDFRAGSRALLGRTVFRDLTAKRDDLVWNEWSTELMFRSSIALGADARVTRDWAKRFRESGREPDPGEIVSPDRMHDKARSILSFDELAVLNAQSGDGLTGDQIEFIFRSEIQQAGPSERDLVIRWTRELLRICRNETPS